MNLLDTFDNIHNYSYYDNDNRRYSELIDNPVSFVRSYFSDGNKLSFLYQSIFDNDDTCQERAMHCVNTYFLGLCIANMLPIIKKDSIGFTEIDYYKEEYNTFLWRWFICSLYHDAFYNAENDETKEFFLPNAYCRFTSGFLYGKTIIENYYQKEATTKTSHDGEIHLDHGIIAANVLYENYTGVLCELLTSGDYDENVRCFYNEGLTVCKNDFGNNRNLVINKNTFLDICRICKMIACHNIYICQNESDAEKYQDAHLEKLISSREGFNKIPKTSSGGVSLFDRMFLLLALTDTLEPCKRGINTSEIEITKQEVVTNSKIRLSVKCVDCVDRKTRKQYYDGIVQLQKWLNYIDSSELNNDGGVDITVDLHLND